jgi:hypothetical protein
MQEPVYVMKDGTNVPYVPVEVKTARDAYAASLHVLFKHVADFHLCVVRTFSVKYGIPEDDILKTIQESDEFKNMHVDPVLCMDMGMNSFGPLEKVPVPESNSEVITAPVTAPVTVPVKSKVKKTKKSEPEPEPPTPVAVATEESRPDADPQPELIKPKTIRKKIVAPQAVDPITPAPFPTPTPEPPTPVAVVATEEVRPDADPQPELIKPKTIRKKIVVPKPTQPITEPEKVAPAAAPATIAPTANTENTTRKIIKKNASK